MGVMFIGEKGQMFADYGGLQALSRRQVQGLQGAGPHDPAFHRALGRVDQGVQGGRPTTCNFDYASCLTEAVLLGNVAYRSGKKLQWDAANLKATNCPEADRFIRREYRKGWEL